MKITKNLKMVASATALTALLFASVSSSAIGEPTEPRGVTNLHTKLKSGDSAVCSKAGFKRAKCLAIRHQVEVELAWPTTASHRE